MLEHIVATENCPERVVVIGGGGFVGGAIMRRLRDRGVETLAVTRREVDLLTAGAPDRLAGLLRSDDSVVAAAAIAPVKNPAMLKDNITLIEAICGALTKCPVAHVLNIGSDAIYADSPAPLAEDSCSAPGSLHGIMHLIREVMMRDAVGDTPFASLRPTLIYGADDPHNGYGPNRFRRIAAKGDPITLFGEGEERRDHVLVEDVAELAVRILMRRSRGVLNAATGTVVSFREVAEMVVSNFETPPPIVGSPRVGPMPHGGYRPFDPAGTYSAFPDFCYTQAAEGIARVHAEVTEDA